MKQAPSLYGGTPLIAAINGNQVEAVQLLIEHKAQLLLLDEHNKAPFQHAYEQGRMDILKTMLNSMRYTALQQMPC